MSSVPQFLYGVATRALPRILTQICRDPGAPFHGSCDRNWWHYKIRDFSSIILQQAGYAVHLAGKLECWRGRSAEFDNLAAAAARFWNRRAVKHGAFEEYYPYEQGYPPVAFSTLAVAKLAHSGVIPISEILPGLTVASKQLLSRFEAQAANQQIAGTAALSVIGRIAPDLIDESTFHDILSRILALQHEEGWFPEYDGPDLGYLAVSIDCLYDIHDHTEDPRILPAIRSAARFIGWFAQSPLGGAGMHNSRNTDYITPYGLVRLALEERDASVLAMVTALFGRQAPHNSGVSCLKTDAEGRPDGSHQPEFTYHPLDAVDDRYWCHYIGHSVLRALVCIEEHGGFPEHTGKDATPVPAAHPGSGHALLGAPQGAVALVSTRKGGIVTGVWPEGGRASDFGWLLETSDKLLVTHWWSLDWENDIAASRATTKGWLVAHKEHTSKPWKHIVLRVASFVLGRRLIKILKRLVIFKKPLQTHHFTREVTWDGDTLVVTDTITPLTERDTVTRAPRTSKRHVASADSFHPEDLALIDGVERTEKIERKNGVFTCETRYSRPAAPQKGQLLS